MRLNFHFFFIPVWFFFLEFRIHTVNGLVGGGVYLYEHLWPVLGDGIGLARRKVLFFFFKYAGKLVKLFWRAGCVLGLSLS